MLKKCSFINLFVQCHRVYPSLKALRLRKGLIVLVNESLTQMLIYSSLNGSIKFYITECFLCHIQTVSCYNSFSSVTFCIDIKLC